jgi:hypothetical protein
MNKKTILILVANPQGTTSLNLLPEVGKLQEALQRSLNRERFTIEWKVAVQQEDFRRHILDVKPWIIHFCGHGTKEGLIVHDENQQAKLLSNQFLSDLLKNFADRLECLVLNACETEPLAEEVTKYINYAIGMNQEVEDRSAIIFAEAFYDAIGAGESIEQAFEIGKNAVLGITSSSIKSRKLTVVDQDVAPVRRQNQEYLIPVLRKKQVLISIIPWGSTGNQEEVSIPPILLNSIEFLFGEGGKIIDEIQARRELDQEMRTDENTSDLFFNSNATKSISSKNAALSSFFREDFWTDLEPRVKQILSLINIHKKNYYLFKKQYALFGGAAFVPPITVNSLTQAEDEIVKNTKELQEILSKVYEKQIMALLD